MQRTKKVVVLAVIRICIQNILLKFIARKTQGVVLNRGLCFFKTIRNRAVTISKPWFVFFYMSIADI